MAGGPRRPSAADAIRRGAALARAVAADPRHRPGVRLRRDRAIRAADPLDGEPLPENAHHDRVPCEVELTPAPHRPGGIPLWVGSWGSRAGFLRMARAGDGWLASATNTPPVGDDVDLDLKRSSPGERVLAVVLAARCSIAIPMHSPAGPRRPRGALRGTPLTLRGGGVPAVHLWPLGDEDRQPVASRVGPPGRARLLVGAERVGAGGPHSGPDAGLSGSAVLHLVRHPFGRDRRGLPARLRGRAGDRAHRRQLRVPEAQAGGRLAAGLHGPWPVYILAGGAVGLIMFAALAALARPLRRVAVAGQQEDDTPSCPGVGGLRQDGSHPLAALITTCSRRRTDDYPGASRDETPGAVRS
jgi:hypothetical protein